MKNILLAVLALGLWSTAFYVSRVEQPMTSPSPSSESGVSLAEEKLHPSASASLSSASRTNAR
jgi:hypothetical protein